MNGNENAIVPIDSKEWIEIQTNEPLTPSQINKQLMVLSTAFPTVVRNFDPYEFKATQELWYSIFKNVPEELFQEAVKKYIINERKGFFPSPGQIIGIITEIVKKREMDDLMKRLMARTNRDFKAVTHNDE